MNGFCLQALTLIERSRATKQRPTAPRLQHQQQTHRVIIRRPARMCVERRQTSNMEMREIQEHERRRKRTKGQRSEAVFQMFATRTSDKKMLWQTLRCRKLRKTSSEIATSTIQKHGTKAKGRNYRGGL